MHTYRTYILGMQADTRSTWELYGTSNALTLGPLARRAIRGDARTLAGGGALAIFSSSFSGATTLPLVVSTRGLVMSRNDASVLKSRPSGTRSARSNTSCDDHPCGSACTPRSPRQRVTSQPSKSSALPTRPLHPAIERRTLLYVFQPELLV